MFGWFRKLKQLATPSPKVGMQGKPLVFNPTHEENASRNIQRMARLEYAIANATDPQEKKRLQAELTRRQSFGR